MRIIRDLHRFPDDATGAAVALGNFDGVHLGHRAIIAECRARAASLGAPAAVLTFEPHPREFFSGTREGLRIYGLHQKMTLLAHTGIDMVYLLRFNAALASTAASDFVSRILHETLGARHLVTGDNFAFGKGREGSSTFLAAHAAALGIGYSALPAVHDKHAQAVSSSAIRASLKDGDITGASRMLGRPYHVSGHIVRGDQRGRTIGFPTANIRLGSRFRPRFGVYAVRMQVDGQWLAGVANLGVKPTFGPHAPMLEVHCFDIERNLYGRHAVVELLHFLRDEQVFPSVESLKTQLAEDCMRARSMA